MGYFSRRSVGISERSLYRADASHPSNENILLFRLIELTDRLEELEELRPHDPMHPLYDRYFYEDYLIRYDGSPNTIQGLLKAIKEVREQIAEREITVGAWKQFIDSVRNTGAAPDGQIVYMDVFLPLTHKRFSV